MIDKLIEQGIQVSPAARGDVKTPCPKCSASRKKKHDPCLSVNVEQGVWQCHNCGWAGGVGGDVKYKGKADYKKPEYQERPKVSKKAIEWFRSRGITDSVLIRNKIASAIEWMPQTQKDEVVVQFPYMKRGDVVNVKSRSREKGFKLVKGAEKTLYGFDDIDAECLFWVEGEIDKLSVEVAGIKSCVSVPNGASDKLVYFEDCADVLDEVQKHVIAVDNDAPGRGLEKELTRRLGAERCWLVTWPEGCKDANDTLSRHGAEKLRETLDAAKPCPVDGLFEVSDFADALVDFYQDGAKPGLDVGWFALEKLYSVKLGEWTLVTGIPSHGKSELVDAMMVNIAESDGWKFGIYSPEHHPLERHASKLLEKRLRKPFRKGPHERMTSEELLKGMAWLEDHFSFMMPPEDDITIDGILNLAKAMVFRKGINGLVIDPWNEIDHAHPQHQSDVDYISEALSKIRRFARKHNIHIWLVAHPTKLQKQSNGNYPVPTPYDVAGAAHFRNKADNCLSVWRDLSVHGGDVQVHVQKVKFKEVGKIGVATLRYDVISGRYLN